MDVPKDEAGKITEKIMIQCFSNLSSHPKGAVVKLETQEYNRAYERIYVIIGQAMESPLDKIGKRIYRDSTKKRETSPY